MNRLLKNFYSRPLGAFKYNSHLSPADTWATEGDCATLRNQFIDVAHTVYEIDLQAGDVNGQQILVPGGRISGGGAVNGNIDNKWWTFDNHHWAVWGGSPIDILFGHWGVGYKVGTDEGLTYSLPGLPTVYVKKGEFAEHGLDNYTIDPAKKAF